MAKKNKLSTPEWITEGFDSKADWEKKHGINSEKKKGRPETFSKKGLQGAKTFKIRECPKCGSDDVGVAISGSDSEEVSGTGQEWECRKCKWKGKDIVEKELIENEFMKYLDEKGEEVA